jgi:hypothetical protein
MSTEQTNSGAPAGSNTSTSSSSGGEQHTRAPNTQGHSPAIDARRAQQSAPAPAQDQGQQNSTPAAEGKMISIGGQEYAESDVLSAISDRAQSQVRKSGLPSSPAEYKATLPENWVAPDGVSFQFDEASPELARARAIAHARGLDQATFSDLLGCFAASQIGTQMQVAQTRAKQLELLGPAGPARLSAIETWLKAKAGNEGGAVANFLKSYPTVQMTTAFERIIRLFSNQGGVNFSQSHRDNDPPASGKIEGYSGKSFAQIRAAQMEQQFGRGSRNNPGR